jgi:tetratricopeptide (TPR) repeat protein
MIFYKCFLSIFIILLVSLFPVSMKGLEATSNGLAEHLVTTPAQSLGSPKAVNSPISNSKEPSIALNATVITASPTFQLIVAIIASGFIGYFLNPFFDLWTTQVKARRAFAAHITDQIEKNVPGYMLMSNYAFLLSLELNRFIQFKREKFCLYDPMNRTSVKEDLEARVEITSKYSLFYAAFLYRIITDYFWIKGGSYFLPDIWGSTAVNDLHSNLIKFITFDTEILLRYVNTTKTQQYQFFQKLNDNKNKDLHDEYAKYKDWVLREDNEVNEFAIAASTYSDIIGQQIGRLYKRKGVEDPRKASQVKRRSGWRRKPAEYLSDVTARQIQRFADERVSTEDKENLRMLHEFALDTEVNYSNAFLVKGWEYYIDGKYELAIEEYTKALEKQPNNPIIYNNLGNAHATIAYVKKTDSEVEYNNAALMYQKALENEKSLAFRRNFGRSYLHVFHRNFGYMYYLQGNYEQAIKCYEEAIKLYPFQYKIGSGEHYHDFSNYCAELGKVYYDKGNWVKATEKYRLAIAMNPGDQILLIDLAHAYTQQDKPKLAQQICKKAIEVTPKKGKDLYELAEHIQDIEVTPKKGKDLYELAIPVYQKAIELAPDEESYHSGMATTWLKLKHPQKAVSAIEEALRWAPMNSKYASDLVQAHEESGDISQEVYDRTTKVCRDAIQMNPNDAANHSYLGLIYYYKKNYELCLDEFSEAIALDPNNSEYYNLLGMAWQGLAENNPDYFVKAQRYYKKALSISAKGVYYKNLGLVLHANEQYDEAFPYLKKANEMIPDDWDVIMYMADVYTYGNNPDINAAIKTYQLAVKIEPDRFESHGSLGGLLFNQKKYSESIESYKTAYILNPNQNAFTNLSNSYLKAIEEDPDNPEFYFGLGCAYERKEKDMSNSSYERKEKEKYYKLAIEKWDKVSPETLNSPSVQKNLGVANEGINKMGKAIEHYKRAIEDYKRAIELEPDNLEAYYNMGSIHFRLAQYQLALWEFQEAFILNPDNPDTVYNIGNCYYKMDQYKDFAREKWEDALRLNSSFSEAFYNLGVFYCKKDDRKSAEKNWQQAIAINPKAEIAHQIRTILQEDNPSNLSICDIKDIHRVHVF